MNRLFTNLLQNASEAASDQQEVRISLIETLEAGKVLIEVKDNGHGIPADLQPRIFMPNFTTKSSGTGLGLAICKAIVEKAGGRIWFNTSERTGTSFFVELPLAV
jgi:signal transduction histidine kinase